MARRGGRGRSASKTAKKKRGTPHAKHAAGAHAGHGARAHAKTGKKTSRRRRGGRGRGAGGGPYKADEGLTSHPTSRNAFVATREWLLGLHGPICAYCGIHYSAKLITLDHVAPRRGQTAYDRRDNLVLACRDCNIKKRDLAPLAFLLGLRSRAANLLRFGAHLSEGLLDLARSLAPEGMRKEEEEEEEEEDDSPYRD